jgi:MbtH protein
MMDYKILVDDDEHYTLWPAQGNCPQGWHEVGGSSSEEECLAHIREVWNTETNA